MKNGISLFSKADLSHVYDINHTIDDEIIKCCLNKIIKCKLKGEFF
jgi:hypothetical protein